MKTIAMVAMVMAIGTGYAMAATVINGHGQILPKAREHKPEPAPTCCYTKVIAGHLPTGGVAVHHKTACVPGCDKPCLTQNR